MPGPALDRATLPEVWVGGPVKANVLGMEIERWQCATTVADFGTGADWATLYSIRSEQPGRGYARRLLVEARRHYELAGKRFGSSVALNERMRNILLSLDITEYR